MEKRVLGRGLAALIPDKVETNQEKSQDIKPTVQQGISKIPLDRIKTNKYQPREDFNQEALEELKKSIEEKGFIQPILVRSSQDGYELIAGERRYRAAKMLNYTEIPAIVKEASDLDSLELSLIENIQRENLNPIDQAKAYKRLMNEFSLTQENVADTVGKDRATVANIMRLLNLPQKIQDYVSHGTVSMGHARALLSLNSETEQLQICSKIIKDDLTVRFIESYVRKSINSKIKKQKEPYQDVNLSAVEQELRDAFGTKVKILKSRKGGKIEIEFYSDKDLERVITILKSNSYNKT